MSESLSGSPELPSPVQMVGSLRGLLRRRNRTLTSEQPSRRDYELGDFSGSEMERELYSHVFILSILLEEHSLEYNTRPSLASAETVKALEDISWYALREYRTAAQVAGLSTEDICRSIARAPSDPSRMQDRRAMLADNLVAGLKEQDSYALYTAQEAQAAIHVMLNGFDLQGHDNA